jgi:hypothetical protein
MMLQFDTPEWLRLRDEKLMEWFGDTSAVELVRILGISTEIGDDLADGDKPITDEQVANLLLSLWVKLPANAFWNTHRGFLTPVIFMSINAWLDANKLQSGTETDRVYSYVLRNLTLQIIPLIVFILHGRQRMRELSLEIHHFFTGHETFDQYEKGEQP